MAFRGNSGNQRPQRPYRPWREQRPSGLSGHTGHQLEQRPSGLSGSASHYWEQRPYRPLSGIAALMAFCRNSGSSGRQRPLAACVELCSSLDNTRVWHYAKLQCIWLEVDWNFPGGSQTSFVLIATGHAESNAQYDCRGFLLMIPTSPRD